MADKRAREILIDVAMGIEPADTAILNGKIVNVHTGRIQPGGVAIKGSRIAAVGDIEYTIGPKTATIDARDQFLAPGLVDPHTHQWHNYVNSTVLAACRLLHGSTAIADGFYGHGIVNGIKAVRFFVDELAATPVKPIFLVPTMCYAQNRCLGFPTSPNAPTIEDLFEALNWPETRGIEETGYDLMLERNRRDSGLLELIERCLRQGKVPTGHSAGLHDNRGLNAWMAAGLMNNHEVVSREEAIQQAELGTHVLIREGSACTDVRQVIPAITENGYPIRAFQLCTDVLTPDWLVERGQMDHAIRVAIKNGLDPIQAIQMSTIQPAEFFRVNHDMGIIAPGRFADIVFLDHLAEFQISKVMANGQLWVEEGKLVRSLQQPTYPKWLYGTMNIDRVLEAADFRVPAPTGTGSTVTVRVINTRDGSLETPESHEKLPVVNGSIVGDPDGGINKIAMIDRIFGTGEVGVAFIKGFGIREGCIGTTANVFNQNIVLVGASDEDMAVAANETIKMGGGFTAIRKGKVVATFPTPLNGLVTDLPFDESFKSQGRLLEAWREMGCPLDTPQMNLEFVTLVTIPAFKICTKGLAYIDGDRYESRVA
jgi:adenine deaminase